MTRCTVLITLLALVFQPLVLAQSSEPKGQLKLEPASLEASEAKLLEAVQDGIRRAGGNPETQAIHFVFAFKTGFFKQDPIRAEAAREVASALVHDLAVAGDRVTARAFEFGLWDHKTPNELTLLLSKSAKADPTKTGDVAKLWPLTPKAGSLGGHDLERAAVELDQNLSRPSDAVIIMLLNSAASQGAPGQTLIGTNSSDYQAMLEHWERVSGTKDGATLEMPFQVIVPNSSPTQAKLAAVVFVPKTFSSTSLSSTRSALLSGQAAAPPSPPSASSGFPWWILVGLLVLGGLAALFLRGAGLGGAGETRAWTLEISDGMPSRFPLADTPNRGVVAVLAGPGYANDGGENVSVIPKAPPQKFARFVRDGNTVRIEGVNDAGLEFKEYDGEYISASPRVSPDPSGPEHTLKFAGDIKNANNVIRHQEITVRFRVVKGEG